MTDNLKWIKPEHRPMSNQFRCPVCGGNVYCINPITREEVPGDLTTKRRVNICNYPACPWCKTTITGSEA